MVVIKKRRRRACWRSLIGFPFILYVIGNIFFHARIASVEHDEAAFAVMTADPPPTLTQPPILVSSGKVMKQRITDPSFSREPFMQKGCELQFVDETMAFCYTADGTLGGELGSRIGTRLLEYHYGCSSKRIPVINVSQESRNERKCLWVDKSTGNHDVVQPGDVIWGSSSYASPANPLLLVADLFQDYYWLPTTNIAKRPHFFNGRRCLIDNAEKPASCPFGKRKCDNVQLSTHQDPFAFLEQLRLCDVIVSNAVVPLVLADSLGIPHVAMNLANEEEYRAHLRATDRTLPGSQTVMSLPPEEDRSILSAKVAESFPYHLIQVPKESMEEKKDLKTLVIIMGSIRGGDVTWNTFYKHMLDLNSADLALVIGELPEEKRKSSLFQRANYIYQFPEFSDWGEAVDSINGSDWRQHILPQANDKWGTWGGVGDKPGSGAVIFMIRWYVANFLVEENLLEKYDRFVLTRSDHYYGCAHDLSLLDNQYMWIPWGEDYKFGVTDRHLVCNRDQILKALDIYPPIVRHPEKYASPQFADLNPEQLLRARWEQEMLWPWVRRFDRVMFTCAVEGDKTRWTEMSASEVKEGVFLKYEFEYEEATCICKTGPCNFPYTRRKMRVGYPQRDQKLV
jgi:hypothetical protein